MKPGTSTSLGALKQVDAGPLSVGYAEAGPAGGPAVILLHGWPYDIHSFADVTPVLTSAGYRVIVMNPWPRASDPQHRCAAARIHRSGAGYRLGSDRGSPNQRSTPLSKRVMAQIRSPVRVRTYRPVPWRMPVGARR